MPDYKDHWDKVYSANELNKLGWYEATPKPSLDLIGKCGLEKNAAILDVGSGAGTLIQNLLNDSYSGIIASDISKVALEKARALLVPEASEKVRWIVDDITNPGYLTEADSIDLWHDRTVLHFLIDEVQQKGYLKTLHNLVRENGYVIIAVFSLEGAKKCSGLDVKNYDHNMIKNFLGGQFKLLEYFNYLYQMPSGDTRPYVYTLFRRVSRG